LVTGDRAAMLVLEVHADLAPGVELDAASDALCRLLRMSGGVLDGVSVRQAIALGRTIENAPPDPSVSAYHTRRPEL
jgi:hypothetical protein